MALDSNLEEMPPRAPGVCIKSYNKPALQPASPFVSQQYPLGESNPADSNSTATDGEPPFGCGTANIDGMLVEELVREPEPVVAAVDVNTRTPEVQPHGTLQPIAGSGDITVEVEHGIRFIVELSILVTSSDYFEGAFRIGSLWSENQCRCVNLPDVSATAFEVFLDRLVDKNRVNDLGLVKDSTREQVPVFVGGKDRICQINVDAGKLSLLVDCYVLADYIQAALFQNEVMLAIMAMYGEVYAQTSQVLLHDLHDLSERTSVHSPLRQFVANTMYAGLSKDT